ncbi:MAG: SpoVA/SpoVAEb family sporulation membrane protein [Firmicutes bacterium]|nr:SpoVA/SpoVAEb family sporulation membrane protein [Bacillota bacterium]
MNGKPQTDAHYDQLVQRYTPPRPITKNCALAFLSGGLLTAAAEALRRWLLARDMAEDAAGGVVVFAVIALTSLLTGLGVYDRLGQVCGAGLAVPISGFANSMTSAALEFKSEGLVLGTGCNAFRLAGAVIVFGIGSAGLLATLALMLNLV